MALTRRQAPVRLTVGGIDTRRDRSLLFHRFRVVEGIVVVQMIIATRRRTLVHGRWQRWLGVVDDVLAAV